MSLVSLGLKPSLRGGWRIFRSAWRLSPMTKIGRTEPAVAPLILRLCTAPGLQPSGRHRLQKRAAGLAGSGRRLVGNHLASLKNVWEAFTQRARRRSSRFFGYVAPDPDLDQVVDLQACEDAYASEARLCALPLLANAEPGQWPDRPALHAPDCRRTCEQVKLAVVVSKPSIHVQRVSGKSQYL